MPEEVTAPDAPVEEIVETPEGVETPETPETPPEPYVVPEDFVQELREWGGPEAAREARQLQQALQTEDGQVDLLVQLLRSVGYGVKEIEYMFSDQFQVPAAGQPLPTPGAVTTPEDDPNEKIITGADLDARLSQMQQEHAQELQQLEMQRAQAVTVQTVNTFFAEKQVEDPAVRDFIVQLGARILPDGDFDPEHVKSALDQAHTQWAAQVEKEARRYAQSKHATAQAQPTHIGGGTAGGDGDEAPAYGTLGQKALDVAKKRVRDRLAAEG